MGPMQELFHLFVHLQLISSIRCQVLRSSCQLTLLWRFLNFKRLKDLNEAFLQFCGYLCVLFLRFYKTYAPLLLVSVKSGVI